VEGVEQGCIIVIIAITATITTFTLQVRGVSGLSWAIEFSFFVPSFLEITLIIYWIFWVS